MSWKNSPTFCGDMNFVVVKIGDKHEKFWPISVDRVFTLERLAGPVAQAIVRLQGSPNDCTLVDRTLTEKDGSVSRELINEAINPELAKFRVKDQSDAIKALIEAVASPSNACLIGDLIMDSMREHFPEGQPRPGGNELLKALPAPRLIELLKGVMQANASVIDPLVARVAPELVKAKGGAKDGKAKRRTKKASAAS